MDISRLDLNDPQNIQLLQRIQAQHEKLIEAVVERDRRISRYHEAKASLTARLGSTEEYAQNASQEVDRLRGELQVTKERSQITESLSKLGEHLTIAALSNEVPTYAGKPRDLNRWLEEIEKHVRIATGNNRDIDLTNTAFRFSKNAVSDYLDKTLKSNPHIAWEELVKDLKSRFGEKLDPQTKLVQLRKFNQRPHQSIQVFAEVIAKKAQEIYSAREIDTDFAQREITSIFAKGLKVKAIAHRIIKELPEKFDQAVQLAVKLEEKQARLSAHGFGEEPMEVDMVDRPRKFNDKTNQKKSFSSPFGQKKTVPSSFGQNKEAWRDGKPVCFRCAKTGHIAKNCFSKTSAGQNGNSVNAVTEEEDWETN